MTGREAAQVQRKSVGEPTDFEFVKNISMKKQDISINNLLDKVNTLEYNSIKDSLAV